MFRHGKLAVTHICRRTAVAVRGSITPAKDRVLPIHKVMSG